MDFNFVGCAATILLQPCALTAVWLSPVPFCVRRLNYLTGGVYVVSQHAQAAKPVSGGEICLDASDRVVAVALMK